MILGTPLSLVISVVIAHQLDRTRFTHGTLLALQFLPLLTSAVAMAWVWRRFYRPVRIGLFNNALASMRFAQVPACTIDTIRVSRNTDAACITITELAKTLVREEGLPFRQAHESAARNARAAIARGVPLGDGYSEFATAFAAEAGRATALDVAAFRTTAAAETIVALIED